MRCQCTMSISNIRTRELPNPQPRRRIVPRGTPVYITGDVWEGIFRHVPQYRYLWGYLNRQCRSIYLSRYSADQRKLDSWIDGHTYTDTPTGRDYSQSYTIPEMIEVCRLHARLGLPYPRAANYHSGCIGVHFAQGIHHTHPSHDRLDVIMAAIPPDEYGVMWYEAWRLLDVGLATLVEHYTRHDWLGWPVRLPSASARLAVHHILTWPVNPILSRVIPSWLVVYPELLQEVITHPGWTGVSPHVSNPSTPVIAMLVIRALRHPRPLTFLRGCDAVWIADTWTYILQELGVMGLVEQLRDYCGSARAFWGMEALMYTCPDHVRAALGGQPWIAYIAELMAQWHPGTSSLFTDESSHRDAILYDHCVIRMATQPGGHHELYRALGNWYERLAYRLRALRFPWDPDYAPALDYVNHGRRVRVRPNKHAHWGRGKHT
jgi:hypothetical protein